MLSESRRSFYTTNQDVEGTCYAHASARMISKFIKVSLNINQDDTANDLSDIYNTVQCQNIFVCLDEFKKTHTITNSQIISALLFRFIYNLIVGFNNYWDRRDGDERHGGGDMLTSITYFFDKIKIITDNEIDTLLDASSAKLLKMESHFDNFKSLIKNFIEKEKNLGPLLLEYKLLTLTSQFKLLNELICSLNAGYYAIIGLDMIESIHNIDSGGHSMVISGYEIVDGSVKLKIKNSWGDRHYGINNNTFEVENGEITISVDELLRIEGKIYLIIIKVNSPIQPLTDWNIFIKDLPETFNFTQVNSIKDDKVDDDFIFTIKCILFFILSKYPTVDLFSPLIVIKEDIFKRLRNIVLTVNMNCQYDGYNLSICEVLNELKKRTGRPSIGRTKINIVQIPNGADVSPTINIFRNFLNENKLQFPVIVSQLCNTLVEPNKGVKISRMLNTRIHPEPDPMRFRENRYRLKKWRIPFFTKYGGKKKQTNRLKTKKK